MTGLGDYVVVDEEPKDAGVREDRVVVDVLVDAAPPLDRTPPFTCPDGEVPRIDRCFLLNPAALDQPNAQAACMEAGAHLATIRNADDNMAASSLGYDSGMARWIGLVGPDGAMNDAAAFRWITGEAATYTNWLPTDPNDNQSCVAFYQGSDANLPSVWVDRACTAALPSICERR